MSESSPAELWKPAYKRVLLKLSGEAFGQAGKVGISLDETLKLSEQLRRVARMGTQVAVVVGGGNLLRGAQFSAGLTTIKQATADAMGMLATVMNGLALQDSLESLDIETRLLSAVPMDTVCEPYIRRRAIRHLEKGRVVILAGGTGNPVRHHRHGGGAAWPGDRRGPADEGDQGGRGVRLRPGQEPARRAVRQADVPEGAARPAEGDGR